MQKKYIYLKDLQATQTFAKDLAKQLSIKKQGIVFLQGNLGSGKTTVVRMLLQTLGWRERVKSPSYSLIEPYVLADLKIYHLDLYRIEDPAEFYFMGLPDLLQEEALFLIEWPERLKEIQLQPDITIFLEIDPEKTHARQGRIEYA